MARRLGLAGVIASLVFACAASANSAEEFSDARAINNSGAVTGGACAPTCSALEAYLLDEHGMESFGTLGGFAAVGDDVNDDGVVVGQADTPETQPSGAHVSVAFVADEQGLHSLGTLPGFDFSEALAVNNRGEIVGWSYSQDPDSGAVLPGSRGFHIDASGTMHDVGDLGGGSVIPRDIANDGTIVGSSTTSSGRTRAFVLRDGEMDALEGLGGSFAEATGVNERGEIVGSATFPGQPNSARRAVYWSPGGEIRDLGTLGGATARAWKINERGEIAGEARLADDSTHAFVIRGGEMQDLGTLGGRNSVATGINDAGEVVGVSQTGRAHPDFGPVQHGFLVDTDGVMLDVGTFSEPGPL